MFGVCVRDVCSNFPRPSFSRFYLVMATCHPNLKTQMALTDTPVTLLIIVLYWNTCTLSTCKNIQFYLKKKKGNQTEKKIIYNNNYK